MVLGIVLTVLNIREKLWPKPVKPHTLHAPLLDIAGAIRETGPGQLTDLSQQVATIRGTVVTMQGMVQANTDALVELRGRLPSSTP